ncbi:hypothetical protein L917_16273 [Phytophthora nicotianae]|uniref:Uncharacterized protein n=1 Tax=Phytophthora nicotianae TaxID=4792 RepID=W2KFE7_PHYNI|nr:hypothetical protein L917_16273 [Phytophthora nicotianae]
MGKQVRTGGAPLTAAIATPATQLEASLQKRWQFYRHRQCLSALAAPPLRTKPRCRHFQIRGVCRTPPASPFICFTAFSGPALPIDPLTTAINPSVRYTKRIKFDCVSRFANFTASSTSISIWTSEHRQLHGNPTWQWPPPPPGQHPQNKTWSHVYEFCPWTSLAPVSCAPAATSVSFQLGY